MIDKRILNIDNLRQFLQNCFFKVGVPEEDCVIVTDNLLKAELWGIDTHGISRFPIYLRRLQKGLVNPKPKIRIEKRLVAVLLVDGDNGLGSVVTAKSLNKGMAVADTYGVCAVGIKRSNHFGAAGYYSNLGAQKGYITIILTNGPPAIPPWGGKEPYFGTNPLAFGLPRQGKPPIIVDLATSLVARGKIIRAAKEGKPIPPDWALNKEGYPTTKAEEALEGILLPMAGPKGYALSLAVEYLAGVLAGAGFGRDVAWQYGNSETEANVGHLLILLKPEAFLDPTDYYSRTERFCEEIKSIALAPDSPGIRLPGERGYKLEQELRKKGIEVTENLANELWTIARELCV
ncbi:MAG: hypothetical protein JG781_1813, partial [Peptococcaceae bacterium]|nr:hypothetical protein [Peptococcaceae bacterium]